MTKHENVNRSMHKMLLNNFLGGIAWSIGVWIGTTVIIALFVSIFTKINLVPIVGDFVTQVEKYVENTKTPFEFK